MVTSEKKDNFQSLEKYYCAKTQVEFHDQFHQHFQVFHMNLKIGFDI